MFSEGNGETRESLSAANIQTGSIESLVCSDTDCPDPSRTSVQNRERSIVSDIGSSHCVPSWWLESSILGLHHGLGTGMGCA